MKDWTQDAVILVKGTAKVTIPKEKEEKYRAMGYRAPGEPQPPPAQKPDIGCC